MIKRCTCYNKYQDKRYGKNMRVFNPTGKGGPAGQGQSSDKGRCTSCGKDS